MERLIREMTPADIPGCLALWGNSDGVVFRVDSDNAEALVRFLQRNPGLSFVTESENKLVGNVLCGHDGRRGYLYHLVVASDFRRAGCASAMLASSLKALAAQGITRCHAFVLSRNVMAQKFWTSVKANQRQDLRVMTLSVGVSN